MPMYDFPNSFANYPCHCIRIMYLEFRKGVYNSFFAQETCFAIVNQSKYVLVTTYDL